MKKILAFLLTAVLVMSAGCCVAFAALSPEAQGVISGITVTDKNEEKADVKVEKIDGKVNKQFQSTLKGLKSETKKKTLKVVGHYDVKVAGNPEYPLNVVLNVLGVSASSDVYVLLQKGSEVVAVTPTVKDGKVSFELDQEYDKIALVTDGKTATKVEKENNVTSPKTMDVTPFAVAMMVVSLVAVAFVSKKVKA